MNLALTIALALIQSALVVLGMYVALKPQPAERFKKWFAVFLVLGIIGCAATVILGFRSGIQLDTIEHNTEQIEGGDGYCWLTPIPPGPSQTDTNPLWSVIVTCKDKKKLPIVGVWGTIQDVLSANPTPEEIFEKSWHFRRFDLGTLSSGGFEPTNLTIKPGDYSISIFTRKNAVLELVHIGSFDWKTGTGDAYSCVYRRDTNELLEGRPTCPKRR